MCIVYMYVCVYITHRHNSEVCVIIESDEYWCYRKLYFWPKLAAILNISHTFSRNSNKLCNWNELDSCLWTNIVLSFASSYPETIFTVRVRTNDSQAGLTDIQLVSESLVFNQPSTHQAVGNIKNSMMFSIKYTLQYQSSVIKLGLLIKNAMDKSPRPKVPVIPRVYCINRKENYSIYEKQNVTCC